MAVNCCPICYPDPCRCAKRQPNCRCGMPESSHTPGCGNYMPAYGESITRRLEGKTSMRVPFIRADNTGFYCTVPLPLKPMIEIPEIYDFTTLGLSEITPPEAEEVSLRTYTLLKFADKVGPRWVYIESRPR